VYIKNDDITDDVRIEPGGNKQTAVECESSLSWPAAAAGEALLTISVILLSVGVYCRQIKTEQRDARWYYTNYFRMSKSLQVML
jgi:hypothetical protein